jgi:hypothetical protein
MRYLKLFEEYNEITIRDVAWLYFLHYAYNGEMKIKSWAHDNRMEVNCDESLRKFKCVKIDDEFYRSTEECGKIVDEYFDCETFEESLRKSEELSEYKNKDQFHGYPINTIPYDLFVNYKHREIHDSFSELHDIFADHWNSQMCLSKNVKRFLAVDHIKEWNFENYIKHFPDEPKTFKVYRGIKDEYNPNKNKIGYSCWTTSKKEAERFASYEFTGGKQFEPMYTDNPYVLEAEVSLDDVAVFVGGTESEVILKNPVKIENIEKITHIKENYNIKNLTILSAFRSKKSDKTGLFGTWYYCDTNPRWTDDLNKEDFNEKELHFNNIYFINDSELEYYDNYVLEYVLIEWFGNNYYEDLNLENKAEVMNLDVGELEMKIVMDEAIKRGYDGIKFGNYEIVDYKTHRE